MRETIKGHGLWVWQTAQTCGGDPARLADQAAELGLGHVLFKVLDGADRRIPDIRFVERVAPLLRERGIQVVPWGYWYSDVPNPVGHLSTPAQAATEVIKVCRDLDCGVFVVNAEREMKRRGQVEKAAEFGPVGGVVGVP